MIEAPADAFVVEGSFGRLAVFTLERSDKATPKNRVVVGEEVFTLGHTQPFSLKGRLRPLLEKSFIGQIVVRALAENERAFMWFVPSGLEISSVLATDKKAVLSPSVDKALSAMAERLVAEVDADALTQLARSVIGVTEAEHVAGFIRSAAEWEALEELDASDDFCAAVRGLTPFAALTNADLAGALQARVIRVPERRRHLPLAIDDPEDWLRHSAFPYDQDELIVKASYRAASKLVMHVALSLGFPALQDADQSLPMLLFDGDSIAANSAVAALCVADMRLVCADGSTVVPVTDPVTCVWEGWPDRLAQLERSWVPPRRMEIRAVRAHAGIEELAAICPGSADELLKLAASSPDLILAVLLTFADHDDHPLNWRRHAKADRRDRIVLDTEAYSRAVLLAILAQNGMGFVGKAAAQFEIVSERLATLATKLEAMYTQGLTDIEARGGEPKVVDAIRRPLQAAVTAMRAATPARLARANGQVELMLSALIAANPRAEVNDEAEDDE